ncbi:iron-sulfur cluster repair di-iron protein [Gracilibacillus dipsosauri]|uniref:Iron-sulfur cluster repair di-iron protein n=1 Tax=Gracilibacillus dipsosauri TaxID=178340 RepID=A0A317KWF7_9BACI|nr:iron-sulfur cluster repair di-iron protein [Gracilibacillus dipsosauri]PWU67623.1 iron-sulfur cluster repair di-iron protein [Gracilibacillus dipsosauri]
MNRFDLEMKTGDIVTQFPKASSLFKQYKIDFCCGGNRPIGEALEKRRLDKEAVLTEINQLYEETNNQDEIDWTSKSNLELIEHIVEKHHGYLKQVLPELSKYVTKVQRVHGEAHPELTTVYTVFHQLKSELESHLEKEESTLFPKLMDNDVEAAAAIIHHFEEEHEHEGRLLELMREVTDDYAIPTGACNTYQLTYLKLDELESDLFLHIHLENNILFPRFTAS